MSVARSFFRKLVPKIIENHLTKNTKIHSLLVFYGGGLEALKNISSKSRIRELENCILTNTNSTN